MEGSRPRIITDQVSGEGQSDQNDELVHEAVGGQRRIEISPKRDSTTRSADDHAKRALRSLHTVFEAPVGGLRGCRALCIHHLDLSRHRTNMCVPEGSSKRQQAARW